MVLISSGYWHQKPQPECLNNRPLFLTVPEAERAKIKVPADSVSCESPLLGLQLAVFLPCPVVVERERDLSWGPAHDLVLVAQLCLSFCDPMDCQSVKSLSRIRLFATPWTATQQDALSMEFSRQEH